MLSATTGGCQNPKKRGTTNAITKRGESFIESQRAYSCDGRDYNCNSNKTNIVIVTVKLN
eukprot:5377891-Amphidinium_carterae.1